MSSRTFQSILFAFCFAGFMVWNQTRGFHHFFMIDDAQNQMLPFYREMGRLWLAGEVPVLTERAFIGGHILFDMQHSIFVPQVILASIVSVLTEDPVVPANLLAFINIFGAFAGAYALGRALKLDHGSSLLVGMTAGGAPLFLHVFQASWWNLAVAYAWSFAAMAAAIAHAFRPSTRRLAAAVVTGSFLVLSGGTQSHIVYGVFVLIASWVRWTETRSLRDAGVLVAPMTIIFLVAAVPAFAEHFALRPLSARGSLYSNGGNFLVTGWGHLFNTFNPFYAEHFHFFGGFRFIGIPIAYSGMAILVFLFFGRFDAGMTPEKKILVMSIVAGVLLAFSPTQFGPVRFPFRFAPYLAVFLMAAAAAFFPLDRPRIDGGRIRLFLSFTIFAAFLQWFSAERSLFAREHLIFVGAFLGLSAAVVAALRSSTLGRRPILVCLTLGLAALALMPFKLTTFARDYLIYVSMTDRVPIRPSGDDCAEMNLTHLIPDGLPGFDRFLPSAQALLSGTKSLGGYSAVGDRRYLSFLPHHFAHGVIDPAAAIDVMFASSTIDPEVPNFELFDLCRIRIRKADAPPDLEAAARAAGMEVAPFAEAFLELSRRDPRPVGTLTYPRAPEIVHVRSRGARYEAYSVPASNVERRLVFARLFYPGYAATLDGARMEVTALDGLLVVATIPAGRGGLLELTHRPVTTEIASACFVAGIALFGFIAVRRKSSQAGASARRERDAAMP